MKTFSAKAEEVSRDWFVVDAADKTLGRLASEIAHRLRGKHKAEYTPHVDTGDYIVVVNAEKIRVTGAKASDKMYHAHSGYPGGLNSISFEKLIDKAPERVLQKAVKGMLPRDIVEIGAEMILGNTFHLMLRPGTEVIKAHGDLHDFTQWQGPILTDSGGFQVFSLGDMSKITEEGVKIKSPISGSPVPLVTT